MSAVTVNMNALKDIRAKQKETLKTAKIDCRDSIVINAREHKIYRRKRIAKWCLNSAVKCRAKNSELDKELKDLASKL